MEPVPLSSTAASAALRLVLRPSYRLVLFLVLIHAGALALTLTLPVAPVVTLMVWVALVTSLGWSLSAAWLKWHAITELTGDAAGEWTLRDATGAEVRARLAPGSYVHPQLVVLNFVPAGWRWRRRTVILLSDMLDAASFRRLRVRLLAGPDMSPEQE